MDIKYLTYNEIVFIHFYVIDEYFTPYKSSKTIKGIFNNSMLKSAINSPRHTYDKKDLYPDIFSKSAALLRSLIKNHPFVDGNKRTAVLSVIAFLEKNGYSLNISQSTLYRLAIKVAQAKPNEKILDYIYEYLKRYSTKQASLFPILGRNI
jgi:death-on-curing protein